jgi:hypothetical protein
MHAILSSGGILACGQHLMLLPYYEVAIVVGEDWDRADHVIFEKVTCLPCLDVLQTAKSRT